MSALTELRGSLAEGGSRGPFSHLFSFLDVIVFSCVGSSNEHDFQLLFVPGAQRVEIITLHIERYRCTLLLIISVEIQN